MKFSFIRHHQPQHSSGSAAGHSGNWSIVNCARGLLRSNQDGGSMVEFALILPMMLTLLTGMTAFAFALNNYMVLTNGLSEGARSLALARGQTNPALAGTDPCAYAIGIANTASPNLVSSKMTYKIVWGTTDALGAPASFTYTTGTCAGVSLKAGDTIQMQGTYPVTLVMYGWTPQLLNMVARTTEMVQ